MRILGIIAFVMTALGSMGASGQTMGGFPSQEGGGANQPATHKAACEKDARLIYRQGRNVSTEWQQQVKATRRADVHDCLVKAGFAS